ARRRVGEPRRAEAVGADADGRIAANRDASRSLSPISLSPAACDTLTGWARRWARILQPTVAAGIARFTAPILRKNRSRPKIGSFDMFRRLWIAAALMLMATSSVPAQEKAADDKNAAATAKADKDAKAKEDATKQDAKADAGDEFQQEFAEWKELLAKLRTLRAKWFSAKPAERKAIEEEYAGLVKQGEEMEPKIIAGAEAAYAAAPDKDPEIGKFLAELVNEEVERDDYEPALKRAKLLIEHKYDNPRI